METIKIRSKQEGFSLIEVLIVSAIMGFVALGTATMVSNQAKDQKMILQKAELTELKTNLATVLGDRTSCSLQFAGVKFNAVLADVNPAPPAPQQASGLITKITYDVTGLGKNPVVTANTLLPGTQTRLAAGNMQLTNIMKAYTGTEQPHYSAILTVYIDPSSSVQSMHPVEVPMVIYTNSPASASAPITACGGTEVTLQATCQSIIGATYDPGSGQCTIPNANSCKGVAAPSGDGSCGYPDPYACPYGGTPGQYACTLQGWKCVNNTCLTYDPSGGGYTPPSGGGDGDGGDDDDGS